MPSLWQRTRLRFLFPYRWIHVVFKATKTPTFGLYMTSFEALIVKMRWTNNEAPRWVEINSMRLDKLNPKNSNFIFYGAQVKRNTSIAICVVTTPVNHTTGWGHNFVLLKKLDLKCKIGREYLFLLLKTVIWSCVCWVDDVTTCNRYLKIAGSINLMANFETVKMLVKDVSFLEENVFRIRFYLHGKLY